MIKATHQYRTYIDDDDDSDDSYDNTAVINDKSYPSVQYIYR